MDRPLCFGGSAENRKPGEQATLTTPFEQVKRFRVLHREFTIEQGEVTATMKVRRKQVLENFRAELDSLYQLSASGRGGE